MKIAPKTFFNFCADHVALLQSLTEQAGEVSESDARRLIRTHCSSNEELAETTWRRLVELQILVRAEPGRDYYFLADQLSRLLSYLFDEAHATTPETISGYIGSLETSTSSFRVQPTLTIQ
jgi:hypothetical protein